MHGATIKRVTNQQFITISSLLFHECYISLPTHSLDLLGPDKREKKFYGFLRYESFPFPYMYALSGPYILFSTLV